MGGNASTGSDNRTTVPQKAKDVLKQINDRNGTTPVGHKGNRKYANDGRNNGQILDTVDADGNAITYREYDVNPASSNRGLERIVIGSDGRAYYTNNHYETFTQIIQ